MERSLSRPLLTVKKEFVTVIFFIGIFLLVITSLNYINLSSVHALRRNQEASIRKVNGATVGQLQTQLYTETFLTLLIAVILSYGLMLLFFEPFLLITQKNISFLRFFRADLLWVQIVTFFLVWLLTSIIPALYYSRLMGLLIQTKNRFSGKGDRLRKAFITIQYSISLMFITGSIVLFGQLSYVQNKDLGFNKENLIILDINSGLARRDFREIITALQQNSSIQIASASSRVPGEWKEIPTGSLSLNRNEDPLTAWHYAVDHRWLETYGMRLKRGRNFSGADASDSLKIILNEEAVKHLNIDDPIGQFIWVYADTISRMEVIGVVENFHFQSLKEKLRPVFLTSWNNPVRAIDYFTIKHAGNPSDALYHIEKVQADFDPETPAEINFLNTQWERYYQADQSRSRLILIATIISVIISVCGLFGLINFTAERKTKEIGIRKVLGASITGIIKLMLRDYFVLLLVALIVSTPLTWWLLNDWLSGFAYRINLSPLLFATAFLMVLLISFATVITRVYDLAKSNPVKSLRYE